MGELYNMVFSLAKAGSSQREVGERLNAVTAYVKKNVPNSDEKSVLIILLGKLASAKVNDRQKEFDAVKTEAIRLTYQIEKKLVAV